MHSVLWFQIFRGVFRLAIRSRKLYAREAIELHLEQLLDAGEVPPGPGGIEALVDNPDLAGWIWSIASIRPEALDDTSERINISMPR